MNFEELYRVIQTLAAQAEVREADAPGRPFHSQRYIAECRALLETLEPYFPDEGGSAPAFTEDSLRSVWDHLFALQDVAQKEAPEKGSKAEPSLLGDDYTDVRGSEGDRDRINELVSLFSQVDVTKGMTLKQSCDSLDEIKNKVFGDPKKMSGMMSDRYLIQATLPDGRRVDGFFTGEEKLFDYDPYGEHANFIRQAKQQHPEDREFVSFCDKILNDPMGANMLLTLFRYDPGRKFYQNPNKYNSTTIQQNGYRKDEFMDVFGNDWINWSLNDNVLRLMADFRTSVKDEEANHAAMRGLTMGKFAPLYPFDAERGSSVPGRNVATSRLANLLGIPELVARTVPMTVKTKNGTTTGVFMEKAQGYEFPDSEEKIPDSHFAYVDRNAFSGKGLKAIADLQILDYLCMQVDRKQSNLFFSFDEKGKLTTVQGIDNDFSFGRENLPDSRSINSGTCLDNLFVISEDMAKTVMTLKPAALRTALGDTGLTKSEIEATCKRLEKLQARVREAQRLPDPKGKVYTRADHVAEPGKLKIVSDDQWEKLDFSLLKTPPDQSLDDANLSENTFRTIGNVEHFIKKYHRSGPEPESIKKGRQNSFAFGEEEDVLTPAALREDKDELEGWITQLEETTRSHGHKQQFEDLLTAVANYRKVKLPETGKVEWETLEQYQRALVDLDKAAQTYVDYKGAERRPSKTGRTRLTLATSLKDALSVQREKVNDAMVKRLEKDLSADAAAARTEETKLTRIVKTLTQQVLENEKFQLIPKFDDVQGMIFRSQTLERLLNADYEKDGKTVEGIDYFAEMAKNDPEQLFEAYQAERNKVDTLLDALTGAHLAQEPLKAGETRDMRRDELRKTAAFREMLCPADGAGPKLDDYLQIQDAGKLYDTFKEIDTDITQYLKREGKYEVEQPAAADKECGEKTMEQPVMK